MRKIAASVRVRTAAIISESGQILVQILRAFWRGACGADLDDGGIVPVPRRCARCVDIQHSEKTGRRQQTNRRGSAMTTWDRISKAAIATLTLGFLSIAVLAGA